MSRVKASFKNSTVSFIFYSLTILLGFISRKVFIQYLGVEILGLNTLIVNLLNFLNLAELGIGSAIAFALYKPLYEKNQIALNEIISVQGYLYKIVAFIIIVCGIVLMFFFSSIFEKAETPLYYAYITFLVMLFSSVLGYFVNYKQNILEADQKQYIVVYCTYGIKLIKSLLQILVVMCFSYPYFCWLFVELIFSIIIAVAIDYNIRKTYPNLEVSVYQGRLLVKKYKDIVAKIKQLLFHKLAGFAVYQSNPVIIYSFTTLTIVAVYGNYMLIVSGITMFLNSAFNGINASIGNLIAEGNRDRVCRIFWELLSIRILIASILCFAILELSGPFITLWVGSQYLLDPLTVCLIVVYQFVQMIRITENFLYAYGLFQDVWAGISEALLHIGLAVIGGYFWGVAGIVAGCIVAVFLIGMIWKPIFLFHTGIKVPSIYYFLKFIKHLATVVASIWISRVCFEALCLDPTLIGGYGNLIVYSIQTMGIYFIVSFLLFYISSQGTRDFVHRFVQIPFPR